MKLPHTPKSLASAVLQGWRIFAGRAWFWRSDRAPALGRVAFHRTASTLCVSGVTDQIGDNRHKERAYNKIVHKNTKKQSDTSNECV